MGNEYNAVITLNFPHTSWSVSQLRLILKVLKTKEDSAIPARKSSLLDCYMEWRGRTPRQMEEVKLVTEEGGGGVPLEGAGDQIYIDTIVNEECITAMLLLNNKGTEEAY